LTCLFCVAKNKVPFAFPSMIIRPILVRLSQIQWKKLSAKCRIYVKIFTFYNKCLKDFRYVCRIAQMLPHSNIAALLIKEVNIVLYDYEKWKKTLPRLFLSVLLFCVFLVGSASQAVAASQTTIMGQSLVTKEQMIKYFQNNNSGRTNDYVTQFVSLVINEAKIEGVRPEIAFTLMMKETNFLKFGGTVKENQNNFGGLGVTGPGVQGEKFDSVEIGIRAIIQHLQAYASNLPLKQQVVDPRYKYVTRGSAPYAEWLGIQENPSGKGWATDPGYGYDIINRVNQINAILPMRMYVDTPYYGSTIRGVHKISGWAINVSGISKAQIFEGSSLIGSADVQLSYPSVNAVYPGYSSGNNSGYSYELDTAKLPNGVHTLKVQATGINSEEVFWNIQVTVDNAPKMYVDTPTSGSQIKGSTQISGWALNMTGISKVELFKGKTLLQTTSSNNYYPSVKVEFPSYPSGNNCGFSMSYDTTKLPNGTQTFAVVATGIDGITTTWPMTLTINNPQMRMYVDTPNYGSTIRGVAKISGWALNVSGISKVQIFEGSNLLGTSDLNLSYPSVNAEFPGYLNGNNSGFSYGLNTAKLPNGVHTLKVQATGKNGEAMFWNIQVRVDNAPKMYVDTPISGSEIKGLTQISGWALNMSRISKVELYKGTTLIQTTSSKNYYSSVNVEFPGYPSGNNSGFSMTYDTTNLPNGTQTFAVVATGIDGITTTWPMTLTINNPPMRMYVDTPTSGSAIRGKTAISGWALNMSGISKVQVFEGSSLLGTADMNLSYPSVNAEFPGYLNGKNSGFTYALDTAQLADGIHTLKVQATGVKGEVIFWNIQVRVDNASKMYVDTPLNGSAIKGLTTISGWALNMSGISKVQIFEGSSLLGTAELNLYYRSVNVAYPGYPTGNNSGFSYVLDTSKLTEGIHTLKVQSTGIDKQVLSWNIQVIVRPPGLLAGVTIVLDPGHGTPDPGAIGYTKNTFEKDGNLAIAQKLAILLRSVGATVYLTRAGDASPASPNYNKSDDLWSRVNKANDLNADLFISIHSNAWTAQSHGTETHYSSINEFNTYSESYKLAKSIQDRLVKNLGLTDRGLVDSDFTVLNHTKMPAVLVEVAFISNPTEEGLLANDNFRQKAATGIYQGVLAYRGF